MLTISDNPYDGYISGLILGGLGRRMDRIKWIVSLFDEIEEPTIIDRARVFSLLLAEAENRFAETEGEETNQSG
jgi:hypothetical protein